MVTIPGGGQGLNPGLQKRPGIFDSLRKLHGNFGYELEQKTRRTSTMCRKNKVKVKLPGEKKEIYAVTPDSEIQEPTALHYEAKTGEDQRQEITFELERLSVFSVVYLRLE